EHERILAIELLERGVEVATVDRLRLLLARLRLGLVLLLLVVLLLLELLMAALVALILLVRLLLALLVVLLMLLLLLVVVLLFFLLVLVLLVLLLLVLLALVVWLLLLLVLLLLVLLVLLVLLLLLLVLLVLLLLVLLVLLLLLVLLVLFFLLLLLLLALAQQRELEVPLGILMLGLDAQALAVRLDRALPVLLREREVAEQVVRGRLHLRVIGQRAVLKQRARAVEIAGRDQDQPAIVIELGPLAAAGDGVVEVLGRGRVVLAIVGVDRRVDVGVGAGQRPREPARLVLGADPQDPQPTDHQRQLQPHDLPSSRRRSPSASASESSTMAGTTKNVKPSSRWISIDDSRWAAARPSTCSRISSSPN